ncbi:hypothetical protein ACFQMM_06450 [Saliphagus sp. GCM10025308]
MAFFGQRAEWPRERLEDGKWNGSARAAVAVSVTVAVAVSIPVPVAIAVT